MNLDNRNELDYELINHKNEDELNEILLDELDLEEEGEEFYHSVNVSESEKRYTLDSQLSDYMDNILEKYRPEERSSIVMNNINLELNRYKELRNMYSEFDNNNNPVLLSERGEFYKPLKEVLFNLNKKLYWLLPVTSTITNIIDNTESDHAYNYAGASA